MEQRLFGKSDFKVSAMGYGAGHIGSPHLSDKEVSLLLNTLLDKGITLFDTAPSYDLSEERLGKSLKHRRSECIFSTKVGYGVPGVPDWTYDCVIQGVDKALRRLHTDYLDIVHFHSCPKGTLEYGEVTAALLETVKAGKVRVAAYSGENEALAYAVDSGQFGGVQCSVNLADQWSLNQVLPQAHHQGMGVIAKRPLANAFWRFEKEPQGEYCHTYWQRWQNMGLRFEMPIHELAVRYALYAPGVHSGIIGSSRLAHIEDNMRLFEKGPLPQDILDTLAEAFHPHWQGEI